MFVLDERLKNDTCWLGDFPLCRVLLMNDSRYPWLILVPRQADISEVFQLSAPQQQTLWQETTQVAHALNTLFAADKMNIATLGNVVNQLHMHVVARMRNDAAWPAPVWGKGTAEPYSAVQIQLLRKQIGKILGENFVAQEETA
ncbi:HIT domain-containing protein [Thiopseudomonas acetoxidans]|uniref:HIT domain-containing protein n=1 Tax=Thiopseudomonas acetoxidans TaxID=3041622 RepID=A0ABT7SRE7_9GAMM|nr:HIT domain-containing protein [Thiopseudomonas sp. CY1220]MDM7858559.1 HIT domain-containing protein [Thiopseudomonas sp. CY1220]